MNSLFALACRKNKKQLVFFLVIILLFTTLMLGTVYAKEAGVKKTPKEIAPGFMEGYLAHEMLPNSLKLLPPPPAENSAAFALDEDVSQQNLALRGTPRWEKAIKDAEVLAIYPYSPGGQGTSIGDYLNGKAKLGPLSEYKKAVRIE